MHKRIENHLTQSVKTWQPLVSKLSLEAKAEIYRIVLKQKEKATDPMLDLSFAITTDREFQDIFGCFYTDPKTKWKAIENLG
jgi:hypothetical protein